MYLEMPTYTITNPKNIAKKIKILALTFISLLAIATITFSQIRQIKASEAFLITLETLAYYPPLAINLQERIIQVIMMIFGAFLIWFTFESFTDYIIEGHLYQNIKRWGKMNSIKLLKDHYIIFGGGRVGEHIASLLKENKKKFVIIENDKKISSDLTKKGFLTLLETENTDNALIIAGVKKAKALITVLPKAEQNILVILSAKEINSRIKVYARSDKVDLVNKLKKAGADFIIVPEFAGADIIVSDILKKKLKKHHFGE
jgi:voltage-gated potassium channel